MTSRVKEKFLHRRSGQPDGEVGRFANYRAMSATPWASYSTRSWNCTNGFRGHGSSTCRATGCPTVSRWSSLRTSQQCTRGTTASACTRLHSTPSCWSTLIAQAWSGLPATSRFRACPYRSARPPYSTSARAAPEQGKTISISPQAEDNVGVEGALVAHLQREVDAMTSSAGALPDRPASWAMSPCPLCPMRRFHTNDATRRRLVAHLR